MRVPADRFNPAGCTDADISGDDFGHLRIADGRSVKVAPRRKDTLRIADRQDARGATRAPPPPPPGDPSASPVPASELTWTIACNQNWRVRESTGSVLSVRLAGVCRVLEHRTWCFLSQTRAYTFDCTP